MNWNTLYSYRRIKDTQAAQDPNRNPYLIDYDRIIFSDAFRKLQDKTQVFPLPGPIFVHNRLTHSLEVASVGRSIGTIVGQGLIERHGWRDDEATFSFYDKHIGTVIAASCLAHDIGNPPFGHSGEDAIRSFFNNEQGALQQELAKHYTQEEWQDLLLFEGNSMAFHLLTQQVAEGQSPFNLTLTTLASIIKYPCVASVGFNKAAGDIALKKSGFFHDDLPLARTVFRSMGMVSRDEGQTSYARHPFVYLTEAADDICYRIIDLEDAYRIGIVSFEKILSLVLPFFAVWRDEEGYKSVVKKIDSFESEAQALSFMRSIWINEMINRCATIFLEHEQALLTGTMRQSLLDSLPDSIKSLVDEVDNFSYKKVYNHPSAVGIEIGGFEIIQVLLQEMIQALLEPNLPKSKKIIQLLSLDKASLAQNNIKQKVSCAVRELVGFTDSFALDFYKKIKGDFRL